MLTYQFYPLSKPAQPLVRVQRYKKFARKGHFLGSGIACQVSWITPLEKGQVSSSSKRVSPVCEAKRGISPVMNFTFSVSRGIQPGNIAVGPGDAAVQACRDIEDYLSHLPDAVYQLKD